VHNGEFYDFERVRRELESSGHRLATKSDSEIAVHGYEDLGAACLAELRGEFAFAIWDARNRQLFAARDRFGIKPLFYAVHDDTIYLASEIKALFAAGVPARWNHEEVYSSVHIQYQSIHRTLFQGVYQVPPGHYMVATESDLRLYKYWDLDLAREADLPTTYDENEYIERFRTLFDEAVRHRLRADVPVGCYLSGGIDSAATLGFASRHATTPIECYTLAFERGDYDETPIAREMAARAGANVHTVPVSQRDILDNFEEAIFHAESLCVNGHGVAKYMLSRAVRKAGLKVVLVGEGSDEVFAGYPHFRRENILAEPDTPERAARLEALANDNPVSAGILLPEGEGMPVESLRRVLGYVPAFLEAKATLAWRTRQVLSDAFKSEFGDRDAYRLLLDSMDVTGQLRGRHPVNQSLYLWNKTALPSYLLVILGDRMEMANSIEGRLPFLDHHLVEFARTLPVSMKIKNGIEKYLLREGARPFITDTVYRRRKHPFLAPPLAGKPDATEASQDIDPLVHDLLHSDSFKALPFYDHKRMLGLLDRVPSMSPRERAATDPVFMMALSAAILQKRFRPTS
jgi:asparagine synthase (glutamine-hydrolysing)